MTSTSFLDSHRNQRTAEGFNIDFRLTPTPNLNKVRFGVNPSFDFVDIFGNSASFSLLPAVLFLI